MVSSEGVCSQLLRLFNDACRLMEIIQRSNIYQVNGQCIIPDKGTKFLISACSFFMSGNVKLYRVAVRMSTQGAE